MGIGYEPNFTARQREEDIVPERLGDAGEFETVLARTLPTDRL